MRETMRTLKRDESRAPVRGWFLAISSLPAGLLVAATTATGAGPDWKALAGKPDDWYRSAEGRRVATNILSWQSAAGSWPKNTNTTAWPFRGEPKTLQGTTRRQKFLCRSRTRLFSCGVSRASWWLPSNFLSNGLAALPSVRGA
jgi:hypothetical protein